MHIEPDSWLGTFVAWATIDDQTWDKLCGDSEMVLERIGAESTMASGAFRLFVMAMSAMATVTLGTLTYVGNRALDKLDSAGDQASKALIQLEAQSKRMDSFELSVSIMQRQLSNVQQRIAKIEGRSNLQ